MLSHQSTNESWADTLEVDAPLTNGDVPTQVALMHALEWTQEVTHLHPQPFHRVDMHLSDAVTIIISRPFLDGVLHGGAVSPDSGVHTVDAYAIVPRPFVGVHLAPFLGEISYLVAARPPGGVTAHSEAHLPTLPTYSTQDGRTIILKRAMTSAFVAPPPGRVPPVGVRLTFFPPHSETSHPFQSVRQGVLRRAAKLVHWLVALCVSGEQSCAPSPTLGLKWHCSRPSALPSAAAPPAEGSDAAARTQCLCRWCRCSGTWDCDNDTPAHDCVWCGGTGEHLPLELCTGRWGSADPARGSALLSNGCILVGRVIRLLEIPYRYSTIFLHLFCT